MARTMSDEQERADRLMAADEWPPQSKGELANALTRAWAELDVACAHAAELQRRLDALPYESEGELVRLLAAREAEVWEARAALALAQSAMEECGEHPLHAASIGELLARAPGDRTALRTLLERALLEQQEVMAQMFGVSVAKESVLDHIARLLALPGDGEQP